MSKKQRYLVGVGAVVLLGAVVFVMATATKEPTDNPTATSTEQVATTTDIFTMEPIVPEAKVSTEGWKTCRNEEYGWEVKYPAEWYVYGEGAYSEHTPILQRTTPCVGESVLISSTDHTTRATTSVSESLHQIPQGSLRISVLTDVTIGKEHKARKTIEDLANLYGVKRSLRGVVLLGDNKERALWSVLGNGNLYYEPYHNSQWYRLSVDAKLDEAYMWTILYTFQFLDTASTTPQ